MKQLPRLSVNGAFEADDVEVFDGPGIMFRAGDDPDWDEMVPSVDTVIRPTAGGRIRVEVCAFGPSDPVETFAASAVQVDVAAEAVRFAAVPGGRSRTIDWDAWPDGRHGHIFLTAVDAA